METERVGKVNPAQDMADKLRDVAKYIRELANNCNNSDIRGVLEDHSKDFDLKAQAALKEANDAENRIRELLAKNGATGRAS
jgi:hypothetical protein